MFTVNQSSLNSILGKGESEEKEGKGEAREVEKEDGAVMLYYNTFGLYSYYHDCKKNQMI